MSEINFESSLTIEEIEENFKDVDFFTGLMKGLNEAIDYSHGKSVENTIVRKRSLPIINVADVRESLGMTQKGFASILGVSTRTVEAWECGRTTPSPTAKKLINLISQDHSLVDRL